MKKTALFIATVAALSLASCKKDHICSCTTTSTTGSTSNTNTNETTYIDARKGDAKKACISSTSTNTYDLGGTTITTTNTTTCELK